jgi:flagellar basal-body rod modification protein FlgD
LTTGNFSTIQFRRAAMDLFGSNSITAAGSAAAARVASALAPQGVKAKDTSGTTPTTASATTAAGTITSSDFLTLLVSELKNQDPTQPTDPNAYIQQLVGVNSLQQLISINQGLTSIESPSTTNTTTDAITGTPAS